MDAVTGIAKAHSPRAEARKLTGLSPAVARNGSSGLKCWGGLTSARPRRRQKSFHVIPRKMCMLSGRSLLAMSVANFVGLSAPVKIDICTLALSCLLTSCQVGLHSYGVPRISTLAVGLGHVAERDVTGGFGARGGR